MYALKYELQGGVPKATPLTLQQFCHGAALQLQKEQLHLDTAIEKLHYQLLKRVENLDMSRFMTTKTLTYTWKLHFVTDAETRILLAPDILTCKIAQELIM